MKLSVIGLVALAFAATPASAATEDCRVLLAAMAARPQPYLEMLSVTGKEPAHAFELLWNGTRKYLQTSRGWMDSQYNTLDPVPTRIPDIVTCRNEGAATLAGQSVIYHTIRIKGHRVSSRVWFASTSGLLVRFVGRAEDGTLLVSTYDYDHVPAMP